MTLLSYLVYLDCIHKHNPSSDKHRRSLNGTIFGVGLPPIEVPAWIIFHTVLGYILLGVGLAALTLRLPTKPTRRWRWLHPYLGYTWIFGTVWMPITAIWCVYAFPGWNVVAFFIFSMYASMQLGWLFIKAYQRRLMKIDDEAPLETSGKKPWKIKIWKILHGVSMGYSFIMLLGAGISFPFRATEQVSHYYDTA